MPQSFLDVARELIERPEAKAAYAEDPDGFLAARGLDSFSAAELEEAVGFVADAVPVPVARQLAGSSPGTAPEPSALAQLAAATAAEEAVREAEPGTIDLVAVLDPGGELGVPDPIGFGVVVPRGPVSDDEAAHDGEGAPVDDHREVDLADELDIKDSEIEEDIEEEGQERLDGAEGNEDALGDPFPGADDVDPGLSDATGTLRGDPLGPDGALGHSADDPLADLE